MVHVVGMTSHNVKMHFHNNRKQFLTVMVRFVGRYSSAAVATCYGLDESRLGGEIFRIRPDRPWGPPSLLYNGYRVFPGGKAAGVRR